MAKACALHPETPSVGLCLACGAAVCETCRLIEAGYVYCQTCYRARKLGALGLEGGAPREAGGAPAPGEGEEARAQGDGAHRCPACGARWVQPYCPVCSLSFGDPPERPVAPALAEEAAQAAGAAGLAETTGSETLAGANFFAYLASSWTGALLRPWEFFAQIPRGGGIAYPIAYLWTMALPALLWSYVFARTEWVDFLARGRVYVGLTILLTAALPFVLAWCLYLYGVLTRGNVTPASAFRIVAYAGSPLVFHGAPYLGAPLALWMFALAAIGLERSGEMTRTRAVVAASSAVLTAWIFRWFALAGIAALSATQGDPTQFVR